MERITKTFIRSILAGIAIGIGGIIYLSCPSRIFGALLFSFGLMTIVVNNLLLYTGKIGYANKIEDIKNIPIIIFGNFIGVYVVSVMCNIAKLNIFNNAFDISYSKLLLTPTQFFARSLLCGVMMFISVESYKQTRKIFPLCIGVMIFILSGFEHSIANIFYFSVSRMWNLRSGLYILLSLIGNGIGAKAFSILLMWSDKWKT